ncbi:hypothetical protein AB0K34_11080 [Actinomadura sp. NPDC049382]|uniref:hypothetical protein n=1 Tax=Actinomadura sp. NPDC049382 TaxID=3158220 RepID=UPI0034228796
MTTREEISLPRQIVLDLVKNAILRCPTQGNNPALADAISTVADAGAKQGYRTSQWLIDARSAWMLAHVSEAGAVYEPGEEREVAVIVQNGVRAALERETPTTCRAMRKLVELGDITLDQPETSEVLP